KSNEFYRFCNCHGHCCKRCCNSGPCCCSSHSCRSYHHGEKRRFCRRDFYSNGRPSCCNRLQRCGRSRNGCRSCHHGEKRRVCRRDYYSKLGWRKGIVSGSRHKKLKPNSSPGASPFVHLLLPQPRMYPWSRYDSGAKKRARRARLEASNKPQTNALHKYFKKTEKLDEPVGNDDEFDEHMDDENQETDGNEEDDGNQETRAPFFISS
ncbi:unnamed protein product, partial [Arabis nemorensis]